VRIVVRLFALLVSLGPLPAPAAETGAVDSIVRAVATADPAPAAPRATVVVDGRTLFEVGPSGPFTASERARLVAQAIEESLAHGAGALDAAQRDAMPTIRIDGRHLLSVTEADVPPGRTRDEQMRAWWRAIDEALARGRMERSAPYVARSLALAGLAFAAALLAQFGLRRLARRVPVWTVRRRGGATPADAPAWTRRLELLLLFPTAAAWLSAIAFTVDRFPGLRAGRTAVTDALARSFGTPLFQLGGKSYTAEDLLVLPVLLVALWLAVRAATDGVGARVLARAGSDRGLQERVLAIARWVLLFVGGLVVLQLWGVDVSSIALAASVLGVGIGFGLQHIANNVVSGVIVTLERPFQPGDVVQVGAYTGRVVRVGGRSTEIRTVDNVSILVPNSRFLENEVVNWTRGDPSCRIHVPVGVAYGSDVGLVRTALLEAARGHGLVLADPPAQVQLRAFGESSLDFELLVWTPEPFGHAALQSDLNFRIEASLHRHGIQVPFPQRDLHLRSPALDALVAAAGRRHYGVEIPQGMELARTSDGAALRGAFDAARGRESWDDDALQSIVARMRAEGGVERRDRRHLLTVHPRCFLGREAVDWLVREEGLTRAEAHAVGGLLVERGLAHHVLDEHVFEDGNLFYRFRADEAPSAAGARARAHG
jgi:small-conductance mechanosensitive channel